MNKTLDISKYISKSNSNTASLYKMPYLNSHDEAKHVGIWKLLGSGEEVLKIVCNTMMRGRGLLIVYCNKSQTI